MGNTRKGSQISALGGESVVESDLDDISSDNVVLIPPPPKAAGKVKVRLHKAQPQPPIIDDSDVG